MSVFFYCFREREEILKIFEMFSGQRMMTSYIRPGGLALEPPRGWHKVVSVLDRLAGKSMSTRNLLAANPIWMSGQRAWAECRWPTCWTLASPVR